MTEMSTGYVDNHTDNNHDLPRENMAETHSATGAQRQGRSKKRDRKSKKSMGAAAVDPNKTYEIRISTPENLPLFQFTVEQTKQAGLRDATSAASSATSRIPLKTKDGYSARSTAAPAIKNKQRAKMADDTTDESGRSSHRRVSDSTGRDGQYETDQTSQDGSPILPESERKLKQTICQLQWDLKGTSDKLEISVQKYGALKDKYNKQIGQRKADYEKLQEMYDRLLEEEQRTDQLEKQLDAVESGKASTQERYDAELRAKDEEIEKLKANQQCAIDTMRSVYEEALSEKIKETEEAKALAAKTEEDLETVRETATTEQFALKKELETERRTSKDCRTAYENMSTNAKGLQDLLHRTAKDYLDASSTDKVTVTNLLKRNQHLERLALQMTELLKGKYSDARNLHHKIDGNIASQEEAKVLRDRVDELTESNECLLDRVQQMSDSCIKHQNAENTAHREANRLQNVIYDREERIDQQREQLRAAEKQFEAHQGSMIPAPFAGLKALERQNDDLRAAFLAEEAAKNNALHEAIKYEELAGYKDIELNASEIKLAETQKELENLEELAGPSIEELKILRALTQNNGHVDESIKQALSCIEDFIVRFVWLQSAHQKLQEKHDILQEEYATVEDRMDTELRQAQDEAMDFRSKYYFQEETTMKQLHDEIHRLKSVIGEAHYIESEQPQNTHVAELNAQPYAEDTGSPNNPPIPTTYAILQTLRPKAYPRLAEAGKVWEQRLYVPMSERRAARRIEAAEQGDAQHLIFSQAVEPVVLTAPHQVGPAGVWTTEAEEQDSVQHMIPAQAVQSVPAAAPYQAGTAALRKEEPTAPRTVVLRGRKNKLRRANPVAEPPVSSPQPWESRFAQFNDMKEELYNDLEDDNKVDFYNKFVRGN